MRFYFRHGVLNNIGIITHLWFNDLVVSALGIRTRGPHFDSQVAPLFHWAATSGKLFTHIASAVSQLQETGVQKGSFRRLGGYGD